jgi:predicted branched-subunit amino acid permease
MLPLLAGVAPFGLVVGATVAASSLDPWVGWSTSWTVYGGTAQLSAVTLLDAGAPLLVLVATVVVVNLRLVVYAAALAPHWRGSPWWWRALACYLLVDPSYAVGAQHVAGDPTPEDHRAHYVGAGLTLWVGWLLCCGLGIAIGDQITDLVPAGLVSELMLVSLVAPALQGRGRRAGIAVAAAIAVPLLVLPLGTGVLVAAVAGGVVAQRLESAGAGRAQDRGAPTPVDPVAEAPR